MSSNFICLIPTNYENMNMLRIDKINIDIIVYMDKKDFNTFKTVQTSLGHRRTQT